MKICPRCKTSNKTEETVCVSCQRDITHVPDGADSFKPDKSQKQKLVMRWIYNIFKAIATLGICLVLNIIAVLSGSYFCIAGIIIALPAAVCPVLADMDPSYSLLGMDVPTNNFSFKKRLIFFCSWIALLVISMGLGIAGIIVA